MSRSHVYHYFPDDSDLVHGVIAATTDAVLGAQDGPFADLESWEGIDRWFAALVCLQEDNQARGGCRSGPWPASWPSVTPPPGRRERMALPAGSITSRFACRD